MKKGNQPSMDKVSKKISQIESEILDGKYRDAVLRAEGLVQTLPFNESVRTIIAKAYFAAGELNSAGKNWALTNDFSQQAVECKERFFKYTENDPKITFESFHFKELPFGKFQSNEVNEFLESLRQQLVEKNYWFKYLYKNNGSLMGAINEFRQEEVLDRHFFLALVHVLGPVLLGSTVMIFIVYAAALQVMAWFG